MGIGKETFLFSLCTPFMESLAKVADEVQKVRL
jgi:hypothetical protein